LYGEIRQAMQINPASANSFATSPERKGDITKFHTQPSKGP
jgi:hypothetical protein